jgi:hypothetical protein
VALEAIRIFLPDVFRAIVEGREGLTTLPDSKRSEEENLRLKQQVENLIRAGPAYPALVKALIERIFPAAGVHIEVPLYRDYEVVAQAWLRERRVAHPDIMALYLEQVANRELRAFAVAERAYAVLSDEQELNRLLRSYDVDSLRDAMVALEAFDGEYPVESVVPASRVLLNLLPDLPPEGPYDAFPGARRAVLDVVTSLIMRLFPRDRRLLAVQAILPGIKSLYAKAQLINKLAYQGTGLKLVDEADAATLEHGLVAELQNAVPEHLKNEPDLLKLLYGAKFWDGGAVIEVDPAQSDLVRALLLDARTVFRYQTISGGVVWRATQLHWDILIEILAGEENLRSGIDGLRQVADAELMGTIELADKYLAGWRPQWMIRSS